MEQYNYRVSFESFTERHFRKQFRKEHKDRWGATELSIIAVCERIDNMLRYSRADLIASVECYKLVKLDFAVVGTRTSPKSSGNRCILFVDEKKRMVSILLVYSKSDVSEQNETQWWKNIVKMEYEEPSRIFGL